MVLTGSYRKSHPPNLLSNKVGFDFQARLNIYLTVINTENTKMKKDVQGVGTPPGSSCAGT